MRVGILKSIIGNQTSTHGSYGFVKIIMEYLATNHLIHQIVTIEKFMMIMKKVALRHKFHLKEEGRAWVNRSFEGQKYFVMRIITSHFIT
jgi:hypothetical protein